MTGSTVTVALGSDVTCTINNDDIAPTLSLVKTVTNDNGGTALPTDWTLTATGPTTISGATGGDEVTEVAVDAGTYDLSESGGPAGYAGGDWSCDGGTLTDASLVLASGETATCTINNDDIESQLTLVKTVTNDSGGTAAAGDWTLTAVGPVTISGASGTAGVTAAVVTVGSYALSEAGGPADYTAGAWSCDGGALTGATLVLALGESAVCTINNNDNPPPLPATGGMLMLWLVMPGLGLIVIGLTLLMMRIRRREGERIG